MDDNKGTIKQHIICKTSSCQMNICIHRLCCCILTEGIGERILVFKLEPQVLIKFTGLSMPSECIPVNF